VAIRTDWHIAKKGRACSGCGAVFPVESPFHSAIYAEKESFLRRDLCEACFQAAPSPPYSHWLTAIPKPDEHRRAFDLGLAADFLRRLAGEPDPARAGLAHFLALLLVRKRLVRLSNLPAKDGPPRARVEFHDGTGPLEIPAPALSEEDVPGLREELGRLLDLGKDAP
jgi:hypothetical protein